MSKAEWSTAETQNIVKAQAATALALLALADIEMGETGRARNRMEQATIWAASAVSQAEADCDRATMLAERGYGD